MIPNPSPITPGPCGQYWVSSLTLSNPLFSATLRPSDGPHVLGNPALAKRITADTTKDAVAAAAVASVFDQVARLSGKSAAVAVVTVSEADPLGPVQVLAVFADKSTYRIADLFAMLADDAAVAAAYGEVMAFLATK